MNILPKFKISDIQASPNYTLYELKNTKTVMLAIFGDSFISVVAKESSRGYWFALGDREDLIPTELKDFEGLFSLRDSTVAQMQDFADTIQGYFKAKTKQVAVMRTCTTTQTQIIEIPIDLEGEALQDFIDNASLTAKEQVESMYTDILD